MIIDALIDKIQLTGNPSVIGLDTCIDYLPHEMQEVCTTLEEAGKQITKFNFDLIDTLKDVIPAVKVQVAYYEMYGVEGMKAFRDTIAYARSNGLIVIADVKRNDIGSTAAAYSKGYIGKCKLAGGEVTPYESDFITVNGYLGSDGILPFVEDCKKYDKGLFALVKTSNPTSGELQDKIMDNGKTLYLINLHLSAYTSDGTISAEQFMILLNDMALLSAEGDYVIAGGDFNKDLLGNSPEVFGVSGADYTWAQPLPVSWIPDQLSLVSSLDEDHPVPSCRNADKPYAPGESFVLIVDGFIVSDNVQVISAQVEDEGFAFSDHNPVSMQFLLAE